MLSGERGNLQSAATELAHLRLPVVPSVTSLERTESNEYERLFRVEFPSVLRTVELIVREHARAEEIAQDAFLQLLLRWSKISRYERPDAWVRRVAIRLAVRSIRRDELWRRLREALVPSVEAPPSPYDLGGAIRRLSASQRAAVVLHYYEDRPTAEIAGILGCSESTARVHLHNARKRLAQLLEEDDRVD